MGEIMFIPGHCKAAAGESGVGEMTGSQAERGLIEESPYGLMDMTLASYVSRLKLKHWPRRKAECRMEFYRHYGLTVCTSTGDLLAASVEFPE